MISTTKRKGGGGGPCLYLRDQSVNGFRDAISSVYCKTLTTPTNEDYCFLGCDILYFSRQKPTFQMKLVPPLCTLKMEVAGSS
jgi:hypothetical protein